MSHSLIEGSVFLVPLRDIGFATGVLARANGVGQCFGYFFGPRVDSSDEVQISSLAIENALLIGKFGDLEIIRGNWKIIGDIPNWESDRWELLPLARIDRDADKAWLCTYDDELNCTRETSISLVEAEKHSYDRLMGAGSVEIRLTKLISTPPQ